jgi:hypothetical protein
MRNPGSRKTSKRRKNKIPRALSLVMLPDGADAGWLCFGVK